MKNISCRMIWFVVLFFLFGSIVNSTQVTASATLQKLTLTVSSLKSCSADLSWNSYSGATYYKVRYKLASGGPWISTINVGLALSYTFTGLISNTAYSFQVLAFNNDGTVLKKSKSNASTLQCDAITSTTVSSANYYDATIMWSPVCSSTKYYVKYKESTSAIWDSVYVENISSYTILNLKPSTVYNAEVLNYCSNTSKYTEGNVVSFTTGRPANIIIVLLDDARYQDYDVTGGPSFFNTPNIDRIYNEGVSFSNNYVVMPLCSPSRSVLQCGLYNHRTGDFTNELIPDTASFVLAPQLKKAGYHTGLIGKSFNAYDGPINGYDYWAGTTAVGAYTNPLFNVNGVQQTINGYFTHIVTDLALQFLDSTPANTPFLLVLGQKAAHAPLTPYSANTGKYDNEKMPFPSNFYQYSNNYPSFLYKGGSVDSNEINKKLKKYYAVLYSIDSSMKEIFNKLEEMGQLDSTLIIYTSDNGYQYGEHKLMGKEVVYEEALKVPLFVRYPAWFPVNTVVNDQFALNVDIVPTVFDAAHITYNGFLDGVSVRKLFDHSVTRNKFLFEIESDGINDETPTSRGIHTTDYKYEYYTCSDTVKELFDLVNDPHENTNLAYNPLYLSIRNQLQMQLDSMRTVMLDTINGLVKDCFRANPLRVENISIDNELEFTAYPNPASEEITITIPKSNDLSSISIFDLLGNKMLNKNIAEHQTALKISLKNFNNGVYFLQWRSGNQMQMKQVVISK